MNAPFRQAWLEEHRVDLSTLRRTDVVGIGHVLAEVDSLVTRLREPDRAAAMGLVPPRGILLWGEPGVGKTLIARYLAASLGSDIPFYEVSADELTPSRIRGALRYLASTHPRSALYLDEIDTFGMSRDYGGHDPATRLLLTATLAALDGLVATPGPVVIASSNRSPRHLDPALVRSGRLGFRIRFDGPSEAERIELLALFLRDVPTEGDLDLAHAAKLTRGKTPSDLRQLCEDAGSLALAANRSRVRDEDLVAAIRRGGRIEPDPDPVEAASVRHRAAIHEAGHVAACVALRGPTWVYAVRIAHGEGVTSYGDERLLAWNRPDDEVRDGLVAGFAGIAAEVAVLGEATAGGKADVSLNTSTALERVAAGLTGDPAPLDLDHLGRNVAESIKERLAAALVEGIGAARARATEIVAANVGPITRFAELLEAAGELTGQALEDAIAHARFTAVDGEPIGTRGNRSNASREEDR